MRVVLWNFNSKLSTFLQFRVKEMTGRYKRFIISLSFLEVSVDINKIKLQKSET